MFLACDGDRVHGSAYGLADRERGDTGRVGGMWVDLAHRRQGAGRALLDAVVAWARERGFTRLALWAPAHSAGARALYARGGFGETGQRRALPSDHTLEIVEMARELRDLAVSRLGSPARSDDRQNPDGHRFHPS
jgi:ribosomal protein S18 acetylase RimI-like enzyme